jgi:hypothetical protein
MWRKHPPKLVLRSGNGMTESATVLARSCTDARAVEVTDGLPKQANVSAREDKQAVHVWRTLKAMPRSFDMAADYQDSVEQVHQAFGDEQYWLARLADSGADDSTLDSIRVGADGRINVMTTQVLARDRLPALVTQIHKGDLQIKREENWTAITGGEATGDITGIMPGAPVTLSGTGHLAPRPDGTGARLTFHAIVDARIPLVGGKIEKFIGNRLMEMLITRQHFTNVWISENS